VVCRVFFWFDLAQEKYIRMQCMYDILPGGRSLERCDGRSRGLKRDLGIESKSGFHHFVYILFPTRPPKWVVEEIVVQTHDWLVIVSPFLSNGDTVLEIHRFCLITVPCGRACRYPRYAKVSSPGRLYHIILSNSTVVGSPVLSGEINHSPLPPHVRLRCSRPVSQP